MCTFDAKCCMMPWFLGRNEPVADEAPESKSCPRTEAVGRKAPAAVNLVGTNLPLQDSCGREVPSQASPIRMAASSTARPWAKECLYGSLSHGAGWSHSHDRPLAGRASANERGGALPSRRFREPKMPAL